MGKKSRTEYSVLNIITGLGGYALNTVLGLVCRMVFTRTLSAEYLGAYFAVSDAPQEISAWDSRLQVTSRGYMLGYNDLKDPSVSGFFRFLAKIGDGMMKMQIVKIGFGGKQ